jgi:rod shape-determining protein MreC
MGLKDSPHQISSTAQPAKTMAQRLAYLALLLAAVAVMMLGKIDASVMERVRVQVTDSIAPILNVISRPVENANRLVAEARDLYSIREVNIKLKQDNARLLQWQTVARKLEAENNALHNLLNFVPDQEARFITARVIADTGGAFANSVLLNAGERDNVRKGQAAITGDGLVGRIAGVGMRSSRVLLITDLNSRIPVIVQPGGVRAIAAGDNSGHPRLIHLPPGAIVGQGDRVVTSGHGGAFPPGLPVGRVSSVLDQGISIRPFIDHTRLGYVRLLDYGLTGIVETPPDQSGMAAVGKKRSGNAIRR